MSAYTSSFTATTEQSVRDRAGSVASLPSLSDSVHGTQWTSSLEEGLLRKMDRFLGGIEAKLDYLEECLIMGAGKVSADQIKEKMSSPSPQLLEAWKKVRECAPAKHERSLLPLLKLLDDREKQNEPTETIETDDADDLSLMGLSRVVSHGAIPKVNYGKIIDRLGKLDAKLDTFEEKYNIMPQNPQQTLQELRSSLYNYEKALVAGSHRLLHFYELPFQWRENPFIIYGYRFSKSHTAAVQSVMHVHNETANIWTHLLGAVFLFFLAFWHYPRTLAYASANIGDCVVMYVFLAAAIKCMLFSVIWHTYANISTLHVRQRFACFDYTGITVLIIASIITTEHIGLRHHALLRNFFVTFSSITGVAAVLFSWSPQFDKPESRYIRIGMFVGLSTLGSAGFFVAAFLDGFSRTFNLFSPLLLSFLGYGVGVVFYGLLIPERWRSDVVIDDIKISDDAILKLDRENKLEEYLNKTPEKTAKFGKFSSLWWVDYICSSHNLWHVFVILGILGHYYATLSMFEKAF